MVEAGTGRLARIPGYRVGGKTGTAQMINPVSRSYADGAYLASFCGFAPVNDPALVGVAMLYDPRGQFYYGGRIAAPLFAAVMKQALRHLDIPPSQRVAEAHAARRRRAGDGGRGSRRRRSDNSARRSFWSPQGSGQQVPLAGLPRTRVAMPRTAPDMLGLTMREAYELAATLGIEIEPSGTGTAQTQIPGPNEALEEGQAVRLHFTPSVGIERAAVESGGGG